MTTAPTTPRAAKHRGHNEGSIYQCKDGRFVGQVTLGNGKKKYFYGKTRKDVSAKLASALRDVKLGIPLPSGKQTLAQYLNLWLEDSVKPNVSPATFESYEAQVRLYIGPRLGALTLEQVTPQRIQTFMNDRRKAGASPHGVRYALTVLRIALNRAVKWRLMAQNPASLVDPPKAAHQETPIISVDTAERILAAAVGTRSEALVTLTLMTGLRRGEALGLRWADLDPDAGLLNVRAQVRRGRDGWEFAELKTRQSRRTLKLPPFVVTALHVQREQVAEARMLAGDRWQEFNLVFPSTIGTPRDGTNVTHEFQACLKRAGLPQMRFHDLRHGTATIQLGQGTGIAEIQKQLGHSQIGLTADLYAHAAPEISERVAAKMEGLFGKR